MRWGGIAGGLIAGVLAFTQMGGMGGGLMGIAVAAIAAVAGAWLMNKGVDTVSGYMQQNKAENKPPAMQRAPSRNFDNMASRSNEPIKLPELQGEIIPNQMIIATADASPDRLLSSPQTPAAAPKSGPQRS
jgi:predicted lipid-binding transport protein (Tim44 family)